MAKYSILTKTRSEPVRMDRFVWTDAQANEIFGQFVWRYDPNQPRHPAGTYEGGRFAPNGSGGGIGSKTRGRVGLNDGIKEELKESRKHKTFEESLRDAHKNQEELVKLGKRLEAETGMKFFENGPKKEESVLRKIRDDGYAGAYEINDLARATFILNSPRDADRVIKALAQEHLVMDKGWSFDSPTGYLDRKILVQYENKGVAEIQLIPKGIFEAKFEGGGHDLYEVIRNRRLPEVERLEAQRKSFKLYSSNLPDTFKPFWSTLNKRAKPRT